VWIDVFRPAKRDSSDFQRKKKSLEYFRGCLWLVSRMCMGNPDTIKYMRTLLRLQDLKGMIDLIDDDTEVAENINLLRLRRNTVEVITALYARPNLRSLSSWDRKRVSREIVEFATDLIDKGKNLLRFEGEKKAHWLAVLRSHELDIAHFYVGREIRIKLHDVLIQQTQDKAPKVFHQLHAIVQRLKAFDEFSSRITDEWRALENILDDLQKRIKHAMREVKDHYKYKANADGTVGIVLRTASDIGFNEAKSKGLFGTQTTRPPSYVEAKSNKFCTPEEATQMLQTSMSAFEIHKELVRIIELSLIAEETHADNSRRVRRRSRTKNMIHIVSSIASSAMGRHERKKSKTVIFGGGGRSSPGTRQGRLQSGLSRQSSSLPGHSSGSTKEFGRGRRKRPLRLNIMHEKDKHFLEKVIQHCLQLLFFYLGIETSSAREYLTVPYGHQNTENVRKLDDVQFLTVAMKLLRFCTPTKTRPTEWQYNCANRTVDILLTVSRERAHFCRLFQGFQIETVFECYTSLRSFRTHEYYTCESMICLLRKVMSPFSGRDLPNREAQIKVFELIEEAKLLVHPDADEKEGRPPPKMSRSLSRASDADHEAEAILAHRRKANASILKTIVEHFSDTKSKDVVASFVDRILKEEQSRHKLIEQGSPKLSISFSPSPSPRDFEQKGKPIVVNSPRSKSKGKHEAALRIEEKRPSPKQHLTLSTPQQRQDTIGLDTRIAHSRSISKSAVSKSAYHALPENPDLDSDSEVKMCDLETLLQWKENLESALNHASTDVNDSEAQVCRAKCYSILALIKRCIHEVRAHRENHYDLLARSFANFEAGEHRKWDDIWHKEISKVFKSESKLQNRTEQSENLWVAKVEVKMSNYKPGGAIRGSLLWEAKKKKSSWPFNQTSKNPSALQKFDFALPDERVLIEEYPALSVLDVEGCSASEAFHFLKLISATGEGKYPRAEIKIQRLLDGENLTRILKDSQHTQIFSRRNSNVERDILIYWVRNGILSLLNDMFINTSQPQRSLDKYLSGLVSHLKEETKMVVKLQLELDAESHQASFVRLPTAFSRFSAPPVPLKANNLEELGETKSRTGSLQPKSPGHLRSSDRLSRRPLTQGSPVELKSRSGSKKKTNSKVSRASLKQLSLSRRLFEKLVNLSCEYSFKLYNVTSGEGEKLRRQTGSLMHEMSVIQYALLQKNKRLLASKNEKIKNAKMLLLSRISRFERRLENEGVRKIAEELRTDLDKVISPIRKKIDSEHLENEDLEIKVNKSRRCSFLCMSGWIWYLITSSLTLTIVTSFFFITSTATAVAVFFYIGYRFISKRLDRAECNPIVRFLMIPLEYIVFPTVIACFGPFILASKFFARLWKGFDDGDKESHPRSTYQAPLYCDAELVEEKDKPYCKTCALSHIRPQLSILEKQIEENRTHVIQSLKSLHFESGFHGEEYLTVPTTPLATLKVKGKDAVTKEERESYQEHVRMFHSIYDLIKKNLPEVSIVLYQAIIQMLDELTVRKRRYSLKDIFSKYRGSNANLGHAVMFLLIAAEFKFAKLSITMIIDSFDLYGKKTRKGTQTAKGLQLANVLLNTGDKRIQEEFLTIMSSDTENRVLAVLKDIIQDFRRNVRVHQEQSSKHLRHDPDEVHILELTFGFMYRMCIGGHGALARDYLRDQEGDRDHNLILETGWFISDIHKGVVQLIRELDPSARSPNTHLSTVIQLTRDAVSVLIQACFGPNEDNQNAIGDMRHLVLALFNILHACVNKYEQLRALENRESKNAGTPNDDYVFVNSPLGTAKTLRFRPTRAASSGSLRNLFMSINPFYSASRKVSNQSKPKMRMDTFKTVTSQDICVTIEKQKAANDRLEYDEVGPDAKENAVPTDIPTVARSRAATVDGVPGMRIWNREFGYEKTGIAEKEIDRLHDLEIHIVKLLRAIMDGQNKHTIKYLAGLLNSNTGVGDNIMEFAEEDEKHQGATHRNRGSVVSGSTDHSDDPIIGCRTLITHLLTFHSDRHRDLLKEYAGDHLNLERQSRSAHLELVLEYYGFISTITDAMDKPSVKQILRDLTLWREHVGKWTKIDEIQPQFYLSQMLMQCEVNMPGGKQERIFFVKPWFFTLGDSGSALEMKRSIRAICVTERRQDKRINDLMDHSSQLWKIAEFHNVRMPKYLEEWHFRNQAKTVVEMMHILRGHFDDIWALTYCTVVVTNILLISWATTDTIDRQPGELFQFRIRSTECRLRQDGYHLAGPGDANECEHFRFIFPVLSFFHLVCATLMVVSWGLSRGIADYYHEATKESESRKKADPDASLAWTEEIRTSRRTRQNRKWQGRAQNYLRVASVAIRITMVQYYVVYGLFSILAAVQTPMWNAFHLVDILTYVPHLRDILFVADQHRSRLLATVALGLIFVYAFSVLVFVFFSNRVIYNVDDDLVYSCDTLWSCVEKAVDLGFRNTPVFKENPVPVVTPLFDLAYFLLINTVLVSIITGIIIDTFAEQREKRDRVEEEISTKCFICRNGHEEFDQSRYHKGFRHHITSEHSMWAYVYLKYHLLSKIEGLPEALSNTELYAGKVLLEGHSNMWQIIPVGNTLFLKDEDLELKGRREQLAIDDSDNDI